MIAYIYSFQYFLISNAFIYISGHCPQDEQPEKVNSIIREWVVTIERESFSVNTEQKK